MKNIYHSDIYKFEKPVNSYWEDTTKEFFSLNKLTKDISSEVAVIGGGYTGLLCAINLIENYNLDVILLEAGKIGWGASSRNGGFCAFPPIKTNFKNLQKIYGKDETKKFFRNSVEGSNYTKSIIQNYNIDCDVSGECNFILAHHPNKFKQIREQGETYKNECCEGWLWNQGIGRTQGTTPRTQNLLKTESPSQGVAGVFILGVAPDESQFKIVWKL